MRTIENLRASVSAIDSLSTHKPFPLSGRDLDSYHRDGRPKKSAEMKYMTLGDEIPLLLFVVTLALPFAARNPDSIAGLVRQWTGTEGEKAYKERVAQRV